MSKRFHTLEAEIREILINCPCTRDSNELLYAKYLAKHGIGNTSVSFFFTNFQEYGVNAFESVTRVRRRLVEKEPYLGSSKKVAEERLNNTADILEYVRG